MCFFIKVYKSASSYLVLISFFTIPYLLPNVSSCEEYRLTNGSNIINSDWNYYNELIGIGDYATINHNNGENNTNGIYLGFPFIVEEIESISGYGINYSIYKNYEVNLGNVVASSNIGKSIISFDVGSQPSRGQYNLNYDGNIHSSIEVIGYGGHGVFIQNGGKNNSELLTVGSNYNVTIQYNYLFDLFPELNETIIENKSISGHGKYDLNDGELTVSTREIIGSNGSTGVFSQDGGTHNTRWLDINDGTNAKGTYNLSDGSLTVWETENVGLGQGTGTFTQTGGTHTVNNILFVGRSATGTFEASAKGTYNLNGGTLNVRNDDNNNNGDYEWIGIGGVGVFNHTAGINNALNLGLGSPGNFVDQGGNGTYNLSGDSSQLNVKDSEVVGVNGTGVFNQSGGTNNTKNLLVGTHNNGSVNGTGTFNLSGGLLNSSGYETIGMTGGIGTFYQTGGINNANGGMAIGSSGTGVYHLSDGTLNVLKAGGTAWENIGNNGGNGEFKQTGGVHNTDNITVGSPGSSTKGVYSLDGSTSKLIVTHAEFIGNQGGTGTFSQNEGSNTIGDNLGVGLNGGKGTYNLSGGSLTVQTNGEGIGNGKDSIGVFNQTGGNNDTFKEVVGFSEGTGTYTQTGGTNNVRDSFTVGGNNGNGLFSLSGDSSQLIVSNNATIGWNEPNSSYTSGYGKFVQTGGMNTVGNNFSVGYNSHGEYNLSGDNAKLIVSGKETIGSHVGTGIFTQSGGTNIISGAMTISNTPGTSSGTYNLNGGTLSVIGGIVNNDSFNYTGGNFNANLTNNGQFNLSGDETRIVNGDVTNNGTVTVNNTDVVYNGTFTNNGAYITDPSTQYFKSLIVGETGFIKGEAGDKIVISGNFISSSKSLLWDTAGVDLQFESGSHTFQFVNDQSWHSLTIDFGSILKLDKGFDNSTPANLFVDIIEGLNIENGVVTNLITEGITVFYDASDEANKNLSGKTFALVGGGFLQAEPTAPVPEPTTILLFGTGLTGLAAVGRRKRR